MKIVKKAGKTYLNFSPADIKALNKRAQSQFSGDPDIYQQMGAPGVEDEYGNEPEAIPPADLEGGAAPDEMGGLPGEEGGSLLADVEAVFAKHKKQMSPEMTTLLEHAEKDVSPNDIDGMTPKDETPPMAPPTGETDTPVTPEAPPTAPQPTPSPVAPSGQPPAFASALGSQIKIANGKAQIKLSKKEWDVVGKKAGWIK